MPLAELAAALGELRPGLDPTDGRLRPPRRGDGDRRLVQRQPGLDGGRAARAGRHRAGVGVPSRCSATWPSWAPFEHDGHAEVGRLAAELGVDRLLVVGEPAAPIHDGATAVANWGGESVLLTDQAAAVEVLRGELRPGDVVLVKGSRYRTWEVADALRADATDEGPPHEGGHRRRRGRVPRLAVRHPDRDQGVHPAARPASRSATDGPATHQGKKGTPTMGGVVFILATVIAYVAGHLALTTLPDAADRPGRADHHRAGAARPDGLLRRGRLPRRLPQGPQAQQRRARTSAASCSARSLVGAVFGVIALYFPSTMTDAGRRPTPRRSAAPR